MCRVLARQFPPAPGSVGGARRWTRRTFERWELDQAAAGDAVLLTSELVTNAVLHARGPVAVRLAVADGMLEIGVGDQDRRAPRRRTPSVPVARAQPAADAAPWARPWLLPEELASEGGRGLLLVEELASEWGVVSMTAGKQVWFRLNAGEAWPYRSDCRCRVEATAVRLESGRQVHAIAGPWDDDPSDT